MNNSRVDFDGDHGTSRSLEMSELDLKGIQVLVIEDNALVRQAMECLLTSWGCQITLSDGALMACDQIRQGNAPDIVLSDYRLNDGYDGINAIRLVREVAGVQIPACLISADAYGDLAHQAQAAGLHLLPKSVTPTRLRSLLWSLHPSRAGSA